MTEIWRNIYNNTSANERERKGFRLPAIIPAVLYNGASNWTAARNFKEIPAEYHLGFALAELEQQAEMRGINNLEVLDSIMEEIFGANTLEEAEDIVKGGLARLCQ